MSLAVADRRAQPAARRRGGAGAAMRSGGEL